MSRSLVYLDVLPESARFAAKFYYARKNGIILGPVPVSGGAYQSPGICVDPFKADIIRYLEHGPPVTEWRRLFADGIAVLEPHGVVTQVAPDERELFDRYEIDLSRIVSGIVLPVPSRRWLPNFVNRFVTRWEMRRLAHRRAVEIERCLLAEHERRPQVTGMSLDPKDGIEFEAIRVLLNERGGMYAISVNSNIPGQVIFALDRQFARKGALAEARDRAVIVQGGTPAAADWIRMRERTNALVLH